MPITTPIQTLKFSQMTAGGSLITNENVPGLLSVDSLPTNVLFNIPWAFLPPGSTADRPTPSAAIDYLLRFNTNNQTYEFYNAITMAWEELSGSGTGTVNPGLINDLAFYAGDGIVLSPITAGANSVLVTNASNVPSLSTTLPSGLSVSGIAITSSTAELSSGQVVASPVNPDDIVNLVYLDSVIPEVTPQALTEINDTNVTMVLGGTPTTALLQAVSMTLGWTGELSLARGGTNADLTASNGGIFYSNASSAAILAGTASANQVLLSGPSSTPAWSSAIYPATTTINQLLFSSSSNLIAGITAADNGVLISSNAGIPSWLANSGTAGFVLTANSGAPPSWQSATASGAIITIDGDSGSITPSSGVVTLSGGATGLTTLGSASTLNLTGTLAIAHGGTSVTSVTTTPTATAFAGWDANKNISANNQPNALTTTVSSGSTIILTVASTQIQNITGSTPQTVQMPVVTTLPAAGFPFVIINNSTATVTIVSSGSNTIGTLLPGYEGNLISILTTGTTAASWYMFVPTFTPAALSEINDTNVTMTLTGEPTISLLQPVTMTLGWTGQLSMARGGTNAALTAANGAIPYSTASSIALLSPTTTAQQLLMSGASSSPQWSTSSYPLTNAANTLLYASSANTMAALATANSGVLITSSGGIPSISSTLPSGIAATNMSLTTPNIGAALATSIQFVSGSYIYGTSATKTVEFISQSGSAVNWIVLSSANTATSPLIQAAGSDINVALELAGQGNGGVLVQGESSGTAIPGGYVGQIILGSSLGPTSFTTTNTPQNFTNLPIPAGVWLVMFTASVTNSSVQTGPTTLSLSTTSATLEGNVGFGNAESNSPVASLFYNLAQSLYINISSTTTYFLVGNSIWTGTAPTLFYQMQAIRIA